MKKHNRLGISLAVCVALISTLAFSTIAFAQKGNDFFSKYRKEAPLYIKEDAITKLEKAKTGNKRIDQEIDRAINHIKNSLEKLLWLNIITLTNTPEGKRVFQEEHQAVMVMQTPKGRPPIIPSEVRAVFTEVTNDLVKADKLIAERAVAEIKIYAGIDEKIDHEIKMAERELAFASKENDPAKTIKRYELAWEHTQYAERHAFSPIVIEKTVAKFIAQMEEICIQTEDMEAAGWGSIPVMHSLIKAGSPAVPKLVEVAKNGSKDWKMRYLIITEVLSKVKDERIPKVLQEILQNSGEREEIREAAATALGIIKENQTIESLINALYNPDASVRASAARSLGLMRDDRAVEHLIGLLKDDESVDVRQMAAGALGNIKDVRAIEPLIETMTNPEEVGIVKVAATSSLGNIGGDRAIEALINELKKNHNVYAAQALGSTKDKRAVEPLIEALKDEDPLVIGYAAEALAKIGDMRAVLPLEEALQRATVKGLKRDIAKALKELTGKEYSY